MDLLLEACQGLGLAIACGALVGGLAGMVPGRAAVTAALAVLAAIAGGALFGWSLEQADHEAWPGWPVGALVAVFACLVIGGVVTGARARIERGSPGSLVGVVALVALALGGLSILVPPIALVAALALVWLASRRQRRAQRKYEGLRVLR